MRAVAKRRFKDKYTDEVYEAGSELEITPERYAEIRATDATLIVAVAEEPEQAAEAAGLTKPKRAKKQAKQDE